MKIKRISYSDECIQAAKKAIKQHKRDIHTLEKEIVVLSRKE